MLMVNRRLERGEDRISALEDRAEEMTCTQHRETRI